MGEWTSVSVAPGLRVGVRVGLEIWVDVGSARRRLTLPQMYDDIEQHAQSRHPTKTNSA